MRRDERGWPASAAEAEAGLADALRDAATGAAPRTVDVYSAAGWVWRYAGDLAPHRDALASPERWQPAAEALREVPLGAALARLAALDHTGGGGAGEADLEREARALLLERDRFFRAQRALLRFAGPAALAAIAAAVRTAAAPVDERLRDEPYLLFRAIPLIDEIRATRGLSLEQQAFWWTAPAAERAALGRYSAGLDPPAAVPATRPGGVIHLWAHALAMAAAPVDADLGPLARAYRAKLPPVALAVPGLGAELRLQPLGGDALLVEVVPAQGSPPPARLLVRIAHEETGAAVEGAVGPRGWVELRLPVGSFPTLDLAVEVIDREGRVLPAAPHPPGA